MTMRRLALSFLILFFVPGCASLPPEEEPAPSVTVANLEVPPEELPPPGECRIWVPGQPAAAQAPSGSCLTLAAGMPKGAWLLHRPAESPEHVEVTVYDSEGGLASLRYYEADTGKYLGRGFVSGGTPSQ